MRNLKDTLDYLKNELGYTHSDLLNFINNTDGVVINGVNYIISGENLALPFMDYKKLQSNIPSQITL